MMRLNTAVPPTPRDAQHPYGVVAEDLAGYPNGRRPGDDTVDIALRVVMGALCHPVPLGAELGVANAKRIRQATSSTSGSARHLPRPVGTAPFTDGAPITAAQLMNAFPYLNTPIPGSPSESNGNDGAGHREGADMQTLMIGSLPKAWRFSSSRLHTLGLRRELRRQGQGCKLHQQPGRRFRQGFLPGS
jgi:hypothetical protein